MRPYIRRRILLAFEKAETETDPAERRRLLNFVVVGGGPTGVEMAGAIAELARNGAGRRFPRASIRAARASSWSRRRRACSPPFDPTLSESRDALRSNARRRGAARRGGDGAATTKASTIGGRAHRGAHDHLGRRRAWRRRPAQWLGAETDRAGRVKVEPDLSVPGHPDIFVIGDTALRPDAGRQAAARRRAGRQAAGRSTSPSC